MTEELHSEPAASFHFVSICDSSALDSASKGFNEVSLSIQKSCLVYQLHVGQVTPVQ